MIIKTFGKYNITPAIDHFKGKLYAIDSDQLSSLSKLNIKSPAVILINDKNFDMPNLLKILDLKIEGAIFQEGGGFYHPAFYLSAEGIPCTVKPEKNISFLVGKEVYFDLTNSQLKTGKDIPRHKPFDSSKYYESLDPEQYATKLSVNVCLRTIKELQYFKRLKDIGIEVDFITLFLEPIIYESGEDPYKVAKSDSTKLKHILQNYISITLDIAKKGVYVRTPEVMAHERGSKEVGAEALTELRGIAYDLHRDNSFLKFLFDLICEMASKPKYRKKLHISLAMPRSVQDVIDDNQVLKARLKEKGYNLIIGKDINLTPFPETPYWLFPTAALPQEVRDLCKEPAKEDYILDSNKKFTWGSGDLTATVMASSRDIPEMRDYLLIKSEVIAMLRESIRAWNKIGFKPDINGNLVCNSFKTYDENTDFFKFLMGSGDISISVFPFAFLDVKKLIRGLETRRK